MAPVIFQAFEPRGNPADALFQLFEQASKFWEFERLDASSVLHRYKWPEIILSEKLEKFSDLLSEEKNWKLPEDDFSERVEPEDCIDLLGKYVSKKKNIYLFLKRIETTAIKFQQSAKGQKYALEEIITCLTDIVLVHEMTHHIMHLSLNHPLKDRSQKYRSQEEICFHEGVAQYFTHLILGNGSGLHADIFTWLNNRQTYRYRVFNALLSYDERDVLAGVAVCTILKEESWTKLQSEIKDASGFSGTIEDKIQHCI